MRQVVAGRYEAGFAGVADRVIPPLIIDAAVSAWALYTVRIGGGRRDGVRAALSDLGIPSVAYYPKPLHQQPAYVDCPAGADLGTSERLCSEVLSLPMHPYLDEEVQEVVVDALGRAL